MPVNIAIPFYILLWIAFGYALNACFWIVSFGDVPLLQFFL